MILAWCVCLAGLSASSVADEEIADEEIASDSFDVEDPTGGLELPPGLADDDALGDLQTLADLADVEVYSASKRSQPLSRTASAAFVLTQEDIRRSGVTTIPDALRLVPGVNVAKLSSDKWAVSVRGFNGRFANKLLVLIDGRSVYTPLFAGVYWEVQDTLLEDVDRIEVIRGPGSSVWGANAVHGVINIITKRPQDTQGAMAVVGGGSEERAFFGLRYGGTIGEDAHYRVYLKGFERDAGFGGFDDWRSLRGGFRTEWNPRARDSFNLQGDLYVVERGHAEWIPTFSAPYSRLAVRDTPLHGGNLLARWKHEIEADSAVSVQLYYDHTSLKHSQAEERRDTLDVEFQHSFTLPLRQTIDWGLGYRGTLDEIENSQTLVVDPDERGLHLVSLFLQDELTAIEEVLTLIGGAKLEYHTLAGFEVLPSARAVLTLGEGHTFWGAASRATRSPSRAENDLTAVQARVPTSPVTGLYPQLLGSSGTDSEELLAFELGYRLQVGETFTLDVAGFYNDYDDLQTLEPAAPTISPLLTPGDVFLPTYFANKMDGQAYGVEVASAWQPLEWMRLSLGYSFLRRSFELDSDSRDATGTAPFHAPRHQATLRAWLDLPWDLELDVGLRYVDVVASLGISNYLVADVRLGWQVPIPSQNLRIDVVAQNLFDDHHPEFATIGLDTATSEVQHGVFAKLTWSLE